MKPVKLKKEVQKKTTQKKDKPKKLTWSLVKGEHFAPAKYNDNEKCMMDGNIETDYFLFL